MRLELPRSSSNPQEQGGYAKFIFQGYGGYDIDFFSEYSFCFSETWCRKSTFVHLQQKQTSQKAGPHNIVLHLVQPRIWYFVPKM